MRIAYFTDSYLPNTDGVVNVLVNLKKELEKKGHEIFVFAPGTRKQKKENKDSSVYYFTSAPFKPYPDYRISLFPFPSTIRLVKEKKIDLIHSHGIATTALAAIQSSKTLHIPAIASCHTMVPVATHYLTKREDLKKLFEDVAWKYIRWQYRHFKKLIVPSRYAERMLRSHGIENTVVLPNGIEYGFFSKGKKGRIRKKHNLKNKNIILHVGRLVKEKNIDFIIENAHGIINKNPDAVFLIVGKGPEERSYKEKVKMNNLEEHFIFTGFVEKKELADYYTDADVLSFTSFFDTQGLVALEAMAAGTPVVAPLESASAEYIKEGKNGYLFKDRLDFPDKISEAIKNKEKMSEECRKIAEEYDVKKTAEKIEEIYLSYVK